MTDDPALARKRASVRALLAARKASKQANATSDYRNETYDMYLHSAGARPVEMERFADWVRRASSEGKYPFESVRISGQRAEVDLVRETGETLHLINMSSYNYLGLGYHPAVIRAAQDAVARYGLGANSSPVISGTYGVHRELERGIVDYFGLPGRGVSLFSSGYAVNLGTIQAFAKPGSVVVLDRSAHMSLLEGAKLSGARIEYFEHNDVDDLDAVLGRVAGGRTRVLVCVEGVYSGDGDFGDLRRVVATSKRYGAMVLVDEAHSVLVAGPGGRGVAEEQGVLSQIDLYVMTFSKAFSGIGGALLARADITQYVNWYAKCRMFSCALDPAVTGGMVKALELAAGAEGDARRRRIRANAAYLEQRLKGRVDLGVSNSWILTVLFGDERKTLDLNDHLQRQGLDTSIMQFPAVPKNEARIRLFVTSEHTRDQLDRAADILLAAADRFDFLTS